MSNPNTKVSQLPQLTVYGNLDQSFQLGPFTDADGAVIDLSAWNAINLAFMQNKNNAGVIELITVVCTGDANGMVIAPLTETDANSLGDAAVNSLISTVLAGKNLVGDPFVPLGNGTARFTNSRVFS